MIVNPIDITPHLNSTEKANIVSSIFQDKNYIENVGDYLSSSFDKIDGFNYQWNSLITSTPLLFEDVDYLRCRQYINSTITPEEVEVYKSGQLRELYGTFENLLVCNLSFYDRIISFCTMIFLHYVRISEDEITHENLEEISYMFDMTPTQIWCCALTSVKSTEWELNYAWQTKLKVLKEVQEKSLLELNWDLLYKNKIFGKFIEYTAIRTNTVGFRASMIMDRTPNKKLAQVCLKFTRTSTAISQNQLETISDYIYEQESINGKLYFEIFQALKKLFNNDETQFGVYVFTREFFIHTSKFSMRVGKNEHGKITKDYLANSYECFVAEESLFETIRTQIEWSRYKLPQEFENEKSILVSLLLEMLKENYREILCIKRMNDFGVLSKITFQGVFNNLYIHENLIFDNRIIKTSRVCMSKENAAKYVVNRGYYIFGNEKDVHDITEISRSIIIEHYSKYCIPIIQHMQNVIVLHTMSKNDIIDVVVRGEINPNKLNNKNIKYTNIKSDVNHKQIMNIMFDKTKTKFDQTKKSYWKAIE